MMGAIANLHGSGFIWECLRMNREVKNGVCVFVFMVEVVKKSDWLIIII